jgi:hypothetical protein
MISEGRDRVSLATGQPLEHFLHWKQTLMSTPDNSSTARFRPCPVLLFLMVITVIAFCDAGKSQDFGLRWQSKAATPLFDHGQ